MLEIIKFIMGLISKNIPNQNLETYDLTKKELEVLLTVIQNSVITLRGGDIQILYDLIWKLQKQYEKIDN